jgi:hypothetical protein
MKKIANLNNNLKKFLFMALGYLLGIVLYGIGKYLFTGHIDIKHLITIFIFLLIGGAIGFFIKNMFDH